jgi:beta-phosphoglucomutase-like phosphatase (HAD superfamily)
MPDDEADTARLLAWVRSTLEAYDGIPAVLAQLRARGVTYAQIREGTRSDTRPRGLPLATAHAWSHRGE